MAATPIWVETRGDGLTLDTAWEPILPTREDGSIIPHYTSMVQDKSDLSSRPLHWPPYKGICRVYIKEEKDLELIKNTIVPPPEVVLLYAIVNEMVPMKVVEFFKDQKSAGLTATENGKKVAGNVLLQLIARGLPRDASDSIIDSLDLSQVSVDEGESDDPSRKSESGVRGERQAG